MGKNFDTVKNYEIARFNVVTILPVGLVLLFFGIFKFISFARYNILVPIAMIVFGLVLSISGFKNLKKLLNFLKK